jgi:probable F420-dependent oxidoreductase
VPEAAAADVAVGLLLPTREQAVAGRAEPAALLELAALAEELGYDSVWAGDSPVARPRLDPVVVLAAVAARTERLGLGTAVLLPALRSPVLLAQTIASLDRLSAGRLTLGVGAGFPFSATEAEFAACGVPFRERIGRLVETVEALRVLWSAEGPASFEGRYLDFHGVFLEPRPFQPGGPRLWLAGAGSKALARAGRLFDGWLPYSPTPEQFGNGLAEVQAAAEEAGRDPDALVAAIYLTVALDDDRSRAERALEQFTHAYYGLPVEAMRQLQAFYGGGSAGLAARISEYVAAGAQEVILRFATLADPRPAVMRVSEQVLPEIHGRIPISRGVKR